MKIFECNIANKRKYLDIGQELIKFFYRHKTFCELFVIDILDFYDKNLLKSILRKLETINIKFNEESEDENEEDENELNEGIIQQKSCFILIYNCKWSDLIDIDIFSYLNNGGYFIILLDGDSLFDKKDEIEEKIKIDQKGLGDTFKEEKGSILKDLKDNEIFFLIFGYEYLKLINEELIKSSLEEDKKIKGKIKKDELPKYIINYKLDFINNGNLYEYLISDIPLEKEEFLFPFEERK